MLQLSCPDGSNKYFITLVDVSLSDRTKYLCNVYSVNEGDFDKIASDTETTEIYSFPSAIYPICERVPSQRVNNVGNILKFKCISEKSHPLVDLKWKNDRSSGNNLKASNVSDAMK